MGTSLIHVMTAIGDSAGEIQAVCDDLVNRRVEREPGCEGTEDWSGRDREETDRFCASLIGSGLNLPILYYASYLDGWNTANQRFHLLEWPDGKARRICGDSYGIAYYPETFHEAFLAQVKAARRRKLYREEQEVRWYLERIHDAIQAVSWLQAPSLVVSISQSLGPSRYDDEIVAALEARAL